MKKIIAVAMLLGLLGCFNLVFLNTSRGDDSDSDKIDTAANAALEQYKKTYGEDSDTYKAILKSFSENVKIAHIQDNDTQAMATIRTIGMAAEKYAAENEAHYPTDEADLTNSAHPYIKESYCGQVVSGYIISCNFKNSSYSITATPITVGVTGTTTYTMTTGGILKP